MNGGDDGGCFLACYRCVSNSHQVLRMIANAAMCAMQNINSVCSSQLRATSLWPVLWISKYNLTKGGLNTVLGNHTYRMGVV